MAAAVRDLAPLAALAYLRELSPGVRAAVLLDGDGSVLAGDGSLAASTGAENPGRLVVREGGLTLAVQLDLPAAGGAPAEVLLELARADALAAIAALGPLVQVERRRDPRP